MWTTPTIKSAAIAGIWSSLGLALTEAWTESASFSSALTYNLAVLSGLGLFFFLPAIFFVIGPNTGAFSRSWFLDAEERAAYWIIAKRLFVYFVCAGVSGIMVSVIATTVFSR